MNRLGPLHGGLLLLLLPSAAVEASPWVTHPTQQPSAGPSSSAPSAPIRRTEAAEELREAVAKAIEPLAGRGGAVEGLAAPVGVGAAALAGRAPGPIPGTASLPPPALVSSMRPVSGQGLATGWTTGRSAPSTPLGSVRKIPIPEPASLVLLTTGVIGVLARRRLLRGLSRIGPDAAPDRP